jgi:hypothetical protein
LLSSKVPRVYTFLLKHIGPGHVFISGPLTIELGQSYIASQTNLEVLGVGIGIDSDFSLTPVANARISFVDPFGVDRCSES